jgi:ABC-type glutathione transport system ATPase component
MSQAARLPFFDRKALGRARHDRQRFRRPLIRSTSCRCIIRWAALCFWASRRCCARSNDVTLDIPKGSLLRPRGRVGSGKTTLGRAILRRRRSVWWARLGITLTRGEVDDDLS